MNITMAHASSMQLKYLPLESLRPERTVHRLLFLERLVHKKKILDLGAFDDDASSDKKKSDRWLHLRLARNASQVLGVDNSPRLSREGLRTSAQSEIRFGSVFDLKPVVQDYPWDIAIAGEIIEHLPDTASFLRHVRENAPTAQSQLVITTPNATSAHNILLGLLSKESCHRDHLQLYSYKTLRTLFERSGWTVERMLPYHLEVHEILVGASPLKVFLVRAFRIFVHFLEKWVPLWAAGWIVVARPKT